MLRYAEAQKRRILIKVFDLLQEDDLVDLDTRFPSAKGWFHGPLRQSVWEQSDMLEASEGPGQIKESSTGAFNDALHHAIACARRRNGPEFARLARETFGMGWCPIARAPGWSQMNMFVTGALSDVYAWHPEPWSMPDDKELLKLEALLCIPDDTDTELPTTEEGIIYYPEMELHVLANDERWFFSAASVAIGFRKL